MRHEPKNSHGEDKVWYAIHEVYYKDDVVDDCSVDSSDTGYTENPVAPIDEELDGLRWVLEQMLAALDKPILEYHDDDEDGASTEVRPST